MSYIRFGEDGSSVYVFLAESGHLECCGCISREHGSFKAYSLGDMLHHLQAHRNAGHRVPRYVDDRLEAEREEIEDFINQKTGERDG